MQSVTRRPPTQCKSHGGRADGAAERSCLSVQRPGERAAGNRAIGRHLQLKSGDAVDAGGAPVERRVAPARGALPEGVRSRMEASFGADFSDVRVHENSSLAKGLNARAFTQGSDIHFAAGAFQPASRDGQEVLSHELAHVLQQRAGRVRTTHEERGHAISDQADLEAEADRAAKSAVAGGRVPGQMARARTTTSTSIQRLSVARSAPLQLFRMLPTGSVVLNMRPDVDNIYLACSNLAHQVEGRVAGNVNWPRRIGRSLENQLASNNLAFFHESFTETEGINFDWDVTIRWRINNARQLGEGTTREVTRSGGGSTTVGSTSSRSQTDTGKLTGSAGGHEGAAGGGAEVSSSTTRSSGQSTSTTLQGGVSSRGQERATTYTAELVAEITVSGSANFAGSDYINPFKWGTSLGSAITTSGPQSGAYHAGTIEYQLSRPG